MMNSNKPAYKLTTKIFGRLNGRSLFGFQLGWNYERMQGFRLSVHDPAAVA